MRWMLLLAVLFVIAFVLLKRRQGSATEGKDAHPYALLDGLFSPAERSFLGVLDQALGGEFRVFGKIRVADVLGVKKGTPKSVWQRAFNRISAKHFDFVLCRPGDLKPLCAIELNDQSHNQNSRQGRDKFLAEACRAAALPLVFFPAQRGYSLAEVSQAINTAMGNQKVSVELKATQQADETPIPVADRGSDATSDVATEPSCPRCASPMVRRVAKSGESAGKEFWGCTRYPACRGRGLS